MEKWKILLCFVLVIVVSTFASHTKKGCQIEEVEYGYVCVNDDNYCDSLDVPHPSGNQYLLVTSAKKKDRFVHKMGKFGQSKKSKSSKECRSIIKIDPSIKYQTIQGWGGGYSGAVTNIVNGLSPNMRKCLFKSYFADAGYNYLRVPIGGTDFDLSPWAYNEYPENDSKLTNFTKLDSRDLERNAQIKELMHVSGNSKLCLLGVTWGPPPWMKFQNDWNGGLDNQLKPEYYQTWADYHLNWMKLMKDDGMKIRAISTGNEPASARQIKFQILSWNASDQAVWIAKNLGPTIRNSEFSDVLIHGFDENRDLAPDWLDGMEQGDKNAFDYIDGWEFHAYSDKALSPKILDHYNKKYPKIDIWYSENCFGAFFMTHYIGPRLGTWGRCEKLISILMENFSHSTVGYIDWNLILDHKGGPSYFNNSVDAYIILSEDGKKMYKQPTFYGMAHFSKFVVPGSVRISTSISECRSAQLKALAFLRPDHKIALIVYNSAVRSVAVTIKDKSKGNIYLILKPKSINTILYDVKSAKKSVSKKAAVKPHHNTRK